jgi:hypothetical protein
MAHKASLVLVDVDLTVTEMIKGEATLQMKIALYTVIMTVTDAYSLKSTNNIPSPEGKRCFYIACHQANPLKR